MTGEEYRRKNWRNMKAAAMLAIILFLFFGLMALKGCATLTCGEVQGHDSYWASWKHAQFSMKGFEACEYVKMVDASRIATPIDDLVYPEITKDYREASDKCQEAIKKSIAEGWWGCPVEGGK
jgi:hypothetical protein